MRSIFRNIALFAAAAALFAAGCSKPAVTDDGHAHEGHAHTEMKDGVRMCAEHGVPEARCVICQPELAAQLAPGEDLPVRLPSTNSAALLGIQTAAPEAGRIASGVDCVAEVSYNQNQLAQISAPVGGVLQTISVDLGGRVEETQTVAKIWSAAIAEAVAKAVLSHQTLERERKLRTGRVTSEASLQEAEATHRAACQQLRLLGFTEARIDELASQPQEQVLLEVRAPFAGEIVERAAVRGALVEAGKPLFTVADRATMWALLQVPESSLDGVKIGLAVELRVDFLPGRVFMGRLTWIAPAVNETTRLVRARAEFDNPEGLLRDKLFATARIVERATENALLVPADAVQYVAAKPFVFVRRAADLFDARAVRVGARREGRVELLAGVKAGEPIAVARAFAIKSAMLMSRLGAGCADD
jgi:membrane fusion protein, heavy metal efflux system